MKNVIIKHLLAAGVILVLLALEEWGIRVGKDFFAGGEEPVL